MKTGTSKYLDFLDCSEFETDVEGFVGCSEFETDVVGFTMFRDKSGDFFLLELSTNFWIRDITFFHITVHNFRLFCLLN